MTPQYKLNYFELQGLGEPIRFLLAYGGIEYEDHRVKYDSWSEVKPTTPFGKLPTLEHEGKVLHQHLAICRYLAKKVNLVGKNDWEAAEVDAIADTITDLRVQFFSIHNEKDEAARATLLKNIQKTTLPFYLEKFDEILKNNGGYFVGGQLTWVDLYLVSLSNMMKKMSSEAEPLSKYSYLKALSEKVLNIPQIKAWVANRPADKF